MVTTTLLSQPGRRGVALENAPAHQAIAWPHGSALFGVVRSSVRHMLNTPFAAPVPAARPDAPTEPTTLTPEFRTTARAAALPWTSLCEQHVVLDTPRARALFVLPFHGEDGPALGPGRPLAAVPGMRLLDLRGYWTTGLSFDPLGLRAAAVEVHDAGHHLVVLDLRSGARTYVTALPGLVDPGAPAWSPDGEWVLVGDAGVTWLVGLRTQALIPVDAARRGAATWWPQAGPATLFVLGGAAGAQHVSTLDLATARHSIVTAVESVPVRCGDAQQSSVWGPVMSPDGDRVLVGDDRGPGAEYQREFGSARRLAVLDPRTGSVVPLAPAFLDRSLRERVHSRWSWSASQRPGARVTLHRSLRARARAFDLSGRGNEPRSRTVSAWLWDASAAAAGAGAGPARAGRAESAGRTVNAGRAVRAAQAERASRQTAA